MKLESVPTPSKSSVRISTARVRSGESEIGSSSSKLVFNSRSMLRPVAAMHWKFATSFFAVRERSAQIPDGLDQPVRRDVLHSHSLREETPHRRRRPVG